MRPVLDTVKLCDMHYCLAHAFEACRRQRRSLQSWTLAAPRQCNAHTAARVAAGFPSDQRNCSWSPIHSILQIPIPPPFSATGSSIYPKKKKSGRENTRVIDTRKPRGLLNKAALSSWQNGFGLRGDLVEKFRHDWFASIFPSVKTKTISNRAAESSPLTKLSN